MNNKDKEYKEKVYNLVGDEYTILGEYTKGKDKILMRHNTCGYEWNVIAANFIRKNRPTRCPECAKKNRVDKLKKSNEDFTKEVYDLVGDEYVFIEEYKGDHTKIKIKHNVCGNIYSVEPNSFLRKRNGGRCPECAKKNRISNSNNNIKNKTKEKFNNCNIKNKTNEEFKQEVYNLVKDEYNILNDYIDDFTKIKFVHNCNSCNNNEFEMLPNDFLNGNRCPKCNKIPEESNQEKELLNFVKNLINKNNKLSPEDKTLFKGKEINLIIPAKNIAIEYDGLFNHTEDKGYNRNYHLNKTNNAKEKGYRLIHIFSDEWVSNNIVAKSKITHILNENNNTKIYARKCYVKEIENSKIKNDFLNNNHIQGEDRASIKLGLYTKDDNKLVSVMTFCKPRRSLGQTDKTNYDYELSRFASDINYNVVGGFGKLLSYFKNNYEWNKLITYADKRWSEGNVYIKNGWTHLHDSKPNYWYTDGRERIHRYNFRKQELKNKFPNIYKDELTEFQIMDKTKYRRIWDCGNMVFEYRKK